MPKFKRTSVAFVFAFAFVLASCTPGQEPASSVVVRQPTASQATPSAGETPKRGGTLVQLRNLRPTAFDPYFALTWSALTYASPVFSQLVRLSPTKASPVTSGDITGDLAERWEISPDGKALTFYLRKGVKWHNGTPFTAKDVKYSIERMADPKTTFFAADFANLASVDIVDPSTVRVNWKVPSAALLGNFATGYSVILSADYHPSKDRKLEEFAMGTGPFKLASSSPGQEYRYERNPDYFLPNLPYLDGITVKVVTNDAMLPAMISGQADLCWWVRGCISSPQEAQRVRQQNPNLKIWPSVARPLGRAVFFNTSQPGPLQSADVRRALALVLDNDGLLSLFGGSDWASRSGFFLPGMGLEVAEINKLVGWDKPKPERVTMAKSLLAKAGYPSGFKASALVRNDSQLHVDAMTLITEAWKNDLGVDVSIDAQETAVELERRSRFDYQIVWYFPALRAGIHPVELSSQFACDSRENWARYCNPDLDKIFATMGGVLGGAELKSLTTKAETTLWTDMPAIAVLYPKDAAVTKADVKGIAPQIWLTNEDFLTVWLDR